jgi:hypothetical protein
MSTIAAAKRSIRELGGFLVTISLLEHDATPRSQGRTSENSVQEKFAEHLLLGRRVNRASEDLGSPYALHRGHNAQSCQLSVNYASPVPCKPDLGLGFSQLARCASGDGDVLPPSERGIRWQPPCSLLL